LARTNATAAGARGAISSRPAWLTSVRPLIRSLVTQNVGVCIQRSADAAFGVAASSARNGVSVWMASGSPSRASVSIVSRSRHGSQRSRASGARSPQPAQMPVLLPRLRSQVSQIAPPSTRRCAARGLPQSRHVTILVRRPAQPRQIAFSGSLAW
jgi:hypothetical protein